MKMLPGRDLAGAWFLVAVPAVGLLSAMLVIIGVQFVLLGLLAEMLVRTYHESQQKPTYRVRTIHNLQGEDSKMPEAKGIGDRG